MSDRRNRLDCCCRGGRHHSARNKQPFRPTNAYNVDHLHPRDIDTNDENNSPATIDYVSATTPDDNARADIDVMS
jgi:hypothetical protein